jgi:hypothetical protein
MSKKEPQNLKGVTDVEVVQLLKKSAGLPQYRAQLPLPKKSLAVKAFQLIGYIPNHFLFRDYVLQ